MNYVQFNDWNIIPMPAAPGARSIKFGMNDSVGDSPNPWTRQSQYQQWPGADWWELDVQLPPLTLPQIRQWRAWFAALRGKANVFQIGDPFGAPGGSPKGNPAGAVSSTLNGPMATTLYTSGWTANKYNLLLPGDYIQLGYRLHMVAGAAAVNSDGSGDAAIEIWPSLRETASGVALKLAKTSGLFRLADNRREYSENYTRLFGLTFKAMEAR